MMNGIFTWMLWKNSIYHRIQALGDAMGHSFEAVAWLANLLNRQVKMLQRDMLIMMGSSIKTKFPNAGDTLYFQIEGMGGVRLELTH